MGVRNPLCCASLFLAVRANGQRAAARPCHGIHRGRHYYASVALPGQLPYSNDLPNVMSCSAESPESPLEMMVKNVRERGYAVEPLVNAIISRPRHWIASTSRNTLLELLGHAMTSLSEFLSLQLIRTVLAETDDRGLGSRICLEGLKSRGIHFALKIMDEIYFAGRSVESGAINAMLRRASKLDDSSSFIKAYRFFRIMNVPLDAETYQIVLLWNCRRDIVELRTLDSSKEALLSSFNSILQDSLNFSLASLSARDQTILDHMKSGRVHLVWDYLRTASPSSCPLPEGTIRGLCLKIQGAAEFATLRPWLRKEERLIWTMESPWANDPDGSFPAAILEAALESSCTGGAFWSRYMQLESLDISTVFARFLTKQQRSIILRAYSSSATADRDVVALVMEGHHKAAHARILGKLFLDKLREEDTAKLLDILRSLALNGLQLPDRAKRHVQPVLVSAAELGHSREVFRVLELLIGDPLFDFRMLDSNKICQALYDHGEVCFANRVVQMLTEAKVMPPTREIYGRMLTTKSMEEVTSFVRTGLQDLALSDSNALSSALQGLLYRRAFREAPLLLLKATNERPQIATLYHFALALQAACMIRDRPLMMQIKRHMHQFGHGDLLYRFQRAIEDLSPPLDIPDAPEHRALGMALLMVVLAETDVSTFFSRFESLFNGSVKPDNEVLRLLLQLVCDEGSSEIRAVVSQGFLSWMERRGVSADRSVYAKLIRLSAGSHDISLFQRVLSHASSRGVQPNYSMFKQLAKFLLRHPQGFAKLPALMELSGSYCIKWDSALIDEIVEEALKRSDLQGAVEWIRRGLAEGRRPGSVTVQTLMSKAYRAWPISLYLDLLREFGSAGYHADADIYQELAQEFAIGANEDELSGILELAWGAVLPNCEHIMRRVLSILLTLGHFQMAHALWRRHCVPRGDQFKDIGSIRQLLEVLLLPSLKDNPHILEAMPANPFLQTAGVEEIVDFAIHAGARLSSAFCQSGLENAMGMFHVDLARKIHRYMFTRGIDHGEGVHRRIGSMWMLQLEAGGGDGSHIQH